MTQFKSGLSLASALAFVALSGGLQAATLSAKGPQDLSSFMILAKHGADDAPGDDRRGRGRGTDDGPGHA